MQDIVYSEPDQPARFAAQQKADDARALRIETIFDGSKLKGKVVLVTGTSRGLGLAIVKELVACGAKTIATVRKTCVAIETAKPSQIITGIDVTQDVSMKKLVAEIREPVDAVIHNAGYFMTERESVLNNTMDFADQLKTIDICSVGILRVTNALWQANQIKQDCKIALLTSQGGSIAWRDVQCPDGGDYGHHMSKACANMAGKLLANELKGKAIVSMLHPGFNRTDMTAKYKHIWDIEGAVDASVGAKRVLHEVNLMTHATAGRFVNCEDGLDIPW